MWLDELHTAWAAWGPWREVAQRAAIGNQTPLFFWLCKLQVALAGASEASFRGLSAAAGVALVPLTWSVVRRGGGTIAGGLAAAVVLALDPDCIFYSQEARPYALAQLAALALAAASLPAAPGAGPAALRILLAALLIHLHLLCGLAAAGLLLGRAVLAGRSRLAWASLAGEALVVGLLCLPLAGLLTTVAQRRQAWTAFVPPPGWEDLWRVVPLTTLILPPLLVLMLALVRRAASTPAASPPAASPKSAPRPASLGPALTILLTACLGMSLAAWGIARMDFAPVFYRRYLIVFWPLWMAASGLLISLGPSRGWRGAAAAVMLAAFAWHHQLPAAWLAQGRAAPSRHEDWRAAAQWLNARRAPDEPLGLRSDYLEADGLNERPADPLLRAYCLAPLATLYRAKGDARRWTPLPTTRSWEHVPPRWWRQGRCWLVLHAAPGTADFIVQQLGRQGAVLAERRSFGNVVVIGLQGAAP